MASPFIVAALAGQPKPELHETCAALEAERTRLVREHARDITKIELELEQVVEALAQQSRSMTSPVKAPARPGAAQERILNAMSRLPQPARPAQIIAEMEAHGPAVNPGTVHNAIKRLVTTGRLDKVEVGQYRLASSNGSGPEPHESATNLAHGGFGRQDAPAPTDGLG